MRACNEMRNKRGSALAITMVFVILLVTLVAAILDMTVTNYSSSTGQVTKSDAFQSSEDGWRLGLNMLNEHFLAADLEEPDFFNSTDEAPQIMRINLDGLDDENSRYYYLFEIRDDGDAGNAGSTNDRKTIRATGFRNDYTDTVEIVVENTVELHQVFANAIYAGNSAGGNYNLELGGYGNDADIVTGSVFANGGIEFNGDSWAEFIEDRQENANMSVAGQNIKTKIDEDRKARATEDIYLEDDAGDDSKAEAFSGDQDAPITRAQIDAIMAAYPQYVVNVNQQFQQNEKPAKTASSNANFTNSTHRNKFWDSYRTYVIDNKNNPAHIFTHGKQYNTGYDGSNDPTINQSINSSNPPAHPNAGANTFHLLDAFDTGVSTGKAASNNQAVTLSGNGTNGESSTEGNMKIYYIEGDLWIHDSNAFDFKLKHAEPDGMKIAFIVKGDIFFSDNIFWNNQTKDFFMFMAIKKDNDPNGNSSGNIHLGDPQFGTVEELDALLYAENNFTENNLGASGSAEFAINGNMTAGNKVDINRDYGNNHSKMVVNYESRLTSDSQQSQNFRDDMPPWMKAIIYKGSTGAGKRNFTVQVWRQDHTLRIRPENAETVTSLEDAYEEIRQHNEAVTE